MSVCSSNLLFSPLTISSESTPQPSRNWGLLSYHTSWNSYPEIISTSCHWKSLVWLCSNTSSSEMITKSITQTLSSSFLHSRFKLWGTSNRSRMDLFTRRYFAEHRSLLLISILSVHYFITWFPQSLSENNLVFFHQQNEFGSVDRNRNSIFLTVWRKFHHSFKLFFDLWSVENVLLILRWISFLS
jgi:hypothetical protein